MSLPPKYEKALEVGQDNECEALERVCSGGKEAGIVFFTRHPNLGLAVAVSAQLEADGLRRALELASADVERLTGSLSLIGNMCHAGCSTEQIETEVWSALAQVEREG